MISQETLDRLDPLSRQEVSKALALLTAYDIWTLQIRVEEKRLLGGSPTQPISELSNDIIEFRLKVGLLSDLHELGLQLTKEL